MRTAINIHLHGDARVTAPEQADGFLEVSGDSDTLNLFLGYDDETRVENIDKLAEALLEIRIRCLQRLALRPEVCVHGQSGSHSTAGMEPRGDGHCSGPGSYWPEQADPITAAKGATERESWTDAG